MADALGLASCTLANSPSSLGDQMIQRRIQGKSWAEIATEFGMPNPSAARSQFQKLTGITDFKIKGKELKHLVDNNLLDQIKVAQPKVAKKAVKAVDNAVDATKAFDTPTPTNVVNKTADELAEEVAKYKEIKQNIAKEMNHFVHYADEMANDIDGWIKDGLNLDYAVVKVGDLYDVDEKLLKDYYKAYKKKKELDAGIFTPDPPLKASDIFAKIQSSNPGNKEYSPGNVTEYIKAYHNEQNSAIKKIYLNTGKDAFKLTDAEFDTLYQYLYGTKPSVQDKLLDVVTAQADDVAKAAKKKIDDTIKSLESQSLDTAVEALDALENKYGSSTIELLMKDYNVSPGYLKLSQKYNMPISDVDDIVWNHLLGGTSGDVWKAYVGKPGSQSGFNKVKDLVFNLRSQGLTQKEIVQLIDIDGDVVDLIIKGQWSTPQPGVNTYVKTAKSSYSGSTYTPPEPPKTTVLYDKADATGYNYAKETNLDDWYRQIKPLEPLDPWATAEQKALRAAQEAADANRLTKDAVDAVRSYTGSTYTSINGDLRAGRSNSYAPRISRAMRPLPEDTRVVRNISSTSAFGGDDVLRQAGGTVWTDKAFMSTTIRKDGVFSGNVTMIIDLPKGSKAIWAKPVSQVSREDELLIDANTKFIITKIEETTKSYGGSTWKVFLKALI